MTGSTLYALAVFGALAFAGGFAWRIGEAAFGAFVRRFWGPRPQDITTARQILELQTRLEHAEASLRTQRAWMDQAKRDAGYPHGVSFDVVWRDALSAILDQRKRLEQ